MDASVLLHAGAGAIGLIAGPIALFSRKGERVHRAAGSVFFMAVMFAALSAVVLAYIEGEMALIVAGALTAYFIGTSWLTVKRPERTAGWLEIGACVFAFAGSAAAAYYAYQSVQNGTALLGGVPFYGFSAVSALCGLLDVSAILRGGLAGRQRIARHLWRMCLGFFIAVVSFFPGQDQLFPDYIMNAEPVILLFLPAFTVLGVMFYWLAVVLGTRRFA